MPVLKNAKYERMAQGLAKGKTADEAYSDAGFKPHRGNASRLSANESIRARVDELLSRVAEKAEWTAADRLSALKSIYDRTATISARSAIAAIAEANKMQGSYAPSKHELTGKIELRPTTIRIVSADDGSDDTATAEAGTDIR